MKRIAHHAMAALCPALAIVLLLGAARATAQPIPWDPPCTVSKVVNTTACAVNITITTTAGNVGPIAVAAFGTAPFVPVVGSLITGIVTQAGAPVGIVSPGPAIPSPPGPFPPVAAAGWVSNVTFGPPPGCCFDVYFDNSSAPGCYVWLVPSAAPPPCTP